MLPEDYVSVTKVVVDADPAGQVASVKKVMLHESYTSVIKVVVDTDPAGVRSNEGCWQGWLLRKHCHAVLPTALHHAWGCRYRHSDRDICNADCGPGCYYCCHPERWVMPAQVYLGIVYKEAALLSVRRSGGDKFACSTATHVLTCIPTEWGTDAQYVGVVFDIGRFGKMSGVGCGIHPILHLPLDFLPAVAPRLGHLSACT